MKFLKYLTILTLALTLLLSACSGQTLPQGGEVGTGSLGTGQLGPSQSTGGNAGTLTPGDAFANAEHLLTIRVLDTGKSDCILIKIDDVVIMMDTADADDYGEICDLLESLGISRIDYLILTHYDNDHIGCAARVVEDFEVTNVYAPNYVRDSGLYRSLMSALEQRAAVTTLHKIQEDTTLPLEVGSMWLNVSRVYPELSHEDPIPEDSMDNDLSLICGLELGEFSALFMGDAEKKRCEDFEAQTAYAGEYDFVKLPHHGNQNKTLREYLSSIRPRYGVICTDNFQSVEVELVNLLRGMGTLIYYSYNGQTVLRTDGKTVECTQAR